MDKKRPGRPRLYKDNAEKLRVFRAKRALEKGQLSGHDVRVAIDVREKVEELYPQLKESLPDFNTITEEEFKVWLREYEGDNYYDNSSWECEECCHENLAYRRTCEECGTLRPQGRDASEEVFLEEYPCCRRWVR